MTKFTQCQFETCFKNTCFSKRHTMPISNMFHRHMYQNGTQHVHSFNKYKKHLLLSAENNSTLNYVIKLQIHLLSNHYLVDRQAIKVTTLLLPILHMSTTQLIRNNNNRLASQLNIDGTTALIKVQVGSKPNNKPYTLSNTTQPLTH